jgi:PncC family amidohydrolase
LDVANDVRSLFVRKGISLALAESCTGGYISHLLTETPGASAYLRASVVAYSRGAKEAVLGVPGRVLGEHGAVSAEAAREMAARVRVLAGADIGLATTGILGPETVEGKPVGLVYIAVAWEGRVETRELRLAGQRAEIKREAARAALSMLLDEVGQWTSAAS